MSGEASARRQVLYTDAVAGTALSARFLIASVFLFWFFSACLRAFFSSSVNLRDSVDGVLVEGPEDGEAEPVTPASL